MKTHYNEKDLKSPDAVTLELKKGFQWSRQHSRLVIGIGLAMIVLGAGWAFEQSIVDGNETKAQEAYFKLENELLKKKEALEKTPAVAADYEKDYAPLLKKYNDMIAHFPTSRAALLASLDASEIELKFNHQDTALQLLGKAKVGSDLLSSLVLLQKGQAEADLKNCPKALDIWTQVLQNKAAQPLYADVHLAQGLCYESVNDKTKAEESYNKILAEAKDSPIAKSAEKYLRLLKVNIN